MVILLLNTLSEFGAARPRFSRFVTVSSLISLQWLDFYVYVIFAVLIFTSFFNKTTSHPLPMSHNVGILLELHDIRSCPLSLVGWTLDRDFLQKRLLVALIDKKEAAYFHLLLISYDCYHLYYFLQFFSICHSWWVRCQFNKVKQVLKHPLMIFLFASMLQFIGFRILCFLCGASTGI